MGTFTISRLEQLFKKVREGLLEKWGGRQGGGQTISIHVKYAFTRSRRLQIAINHLKNPGVCMTKQFC
jgi:hypothetical protein